MLAIARAMAVLCALIGTICRVHSATPDCFPASELLSTERIPHEPRPPAPAITQSLRDTRFVIELGVLERETT